jgi:regulatory protein
LNTKESLRELSRAKKYSFRLLAIRARSKEELKKRLNKKGFDKQVTEKVIAYLEDLGYLNDREFARTWVRSRQLTHPLGISALKYKLKTKGISEDIVGEVLEDYDLSQERSLALILAQKQLRRYQGHNREKCRQRLYAFLKRRGFEHELILELLDELAI